MKYFLLTLFFPVFLYAQIPQNAPWISLPDANNKASEITFDKMVKDANLFFEGIDISKKGSGYKPFKRWEYHWSFYKKPDGSIAPPSVLWEAWKAKQILEKSSQNISNKIESNWQSIGPYSFTDTGSWSAGQGRINCITVDPNNANIYYAGAPSGGLWKSTDAGISWTTLTDYLPQIGVSGIAVDKNNSNNIYITTGDDDAADSYFVGVMKSTDGGLTWNNTAPLGGNINDTANDIFIDPSNSNIIWVATSKGLFKSTDAGASWDLKLNGNIKDIKLKPNTPNTVYAVTSSAFYKATDGNSFTQISNGLPTSSSRLTIDVTPANPNLVYILSSSSTRKFQGVYKSTDSGLSFTKTLENDDIFDGSDQSWFDFALGVSDTDANTLFVGVLNVWKSTDGGNDFVRINAWNQDTQETYTHADIHFLRYYNGVLFAGTDGGLYRSTNNGNTFNSLTTGMAIGQFYKISVSKQSSQKIVGGLQDNGGFAYSNNTWHNYHGADGMDAAVHPTNSNQYYGFTQYGGSLFATDNGGLNSSFVTSAPAGQSGEWVTPLVIDKQGNLYAGYKNLYKLQNNIWQPVSTFDFGGNLTQIEIDPIDNKIIYVARNEYLYKSTDGGLNFNLLFIPYSGNYISSIEVNNHNSNIVYYTTSGASGKVYKSTDAGTNWIDISGNLPFESKNVIRHQKYHPNNPVYVGTYLGVYYLDDTSSDWQVFSKNLPNVEITDIEITEIDGIITASTYGRGVWQSPIPVLLIDHDISLLEVLKPNNINCGEISPILKVKNTGANTINQVTLNYTLANSSYTETWNGSIPSLETKEISLNSFSLPKGVYNLQVNSTIINDAYDDNNANELTFYINEADDTPHIANSFEGRNDGWLVITNGSVDNSDLWFPASPTKLLLNTVSTGVKAYITNPNGNYPNNITSDLVVPCVDLTKIQNPVMKFKMSFDIELDWDVLYVQYSTDNGLSWYVLGTANDPNWYNNSSSENDLTIGGQWSGTDATLKEYSYDLANFTDESQIIFKFHFASDQLENGEGALIDDFVIAGTLGTEDVQFENMVSLFPNPAEEYFSIKWPHSESAVMQMYDITGKKIMEKTIDATSMSQFNSSSYSKGVYLLYFKTDRYFFSKKLVIK